MNDKCELAEDRRGQSPRPLLLEHKRHRVGTAPTDEQQFYKILTEAIWLNGLLNRFLKLEKQLYEIVSKPARLNELFVQFLKLAQHGDGGIEKQLAGEVLARIYVSLHKHSGKLKKVNPTFRETVIKIGKIRSDVLLPKSPVGQVLQDELRTAERYQFKLLLLRKLIKTQPGLYLVVVDKKAVERRLQDELVWQNLGFSTLASGKENGGARSGALWTREGIREIEKRAREGAADPGRIYPDEVTEKRRATWQDVAREWKIPEEYWPTADLKPFSAESEQNWWKFVWSRLKKRQAEILPCLRKSGEGRWEAKDGKLHLKHFYKQFRKHWLTLVNERAAGTF